MAKTTVPAPTHSPAGRPVRRKLADRTALSDRLLTEAAFQLLVKLGVQGTTLQAVGKRAGYSRALATHRFGSKAGLFDQMLKQASADWLQRMQKAVGRRTGPDALCAATRAAEKFVRERPSEVRAMYLLWFQSIGPGAAYHSNLANVHRAQRRDVEAWIRAGQEAGEVSKTVNPRRLAEQYCATIAGIAYQWLVNPEMPLTPMYRQLESDIRLRLAAEVPARRARS
ncbi:MAG: TetR/AcrR family transcriptional regulator [Steroidobacteraceae bacterium]